MATQLIKGFAMVVLVVVMSLVTAVVSAQGQSVKKLRATIPFEFTVGSANLSAGEYNVRSINDDGDVILVSGQSKAQNAVRMSNPMTAATAPKTGKLVFHRYGNRYFLSEIWTPGQNAGRQLRMSKAERAIQRELQSVASSKHVYELVELAANCPRD